MKIIKRIKIIIGACAVLCALIGVAMLQTNLFKAEAATSETDKKMQLTMVKGASVRLGNADNNYGLRFAAGMSEKNYSQIIADVEQGAYSSVSFGMVIAPENYLTEYADFTEENLFGASAKYDWAVDGVYNGSNGKNGSPVRIINLTFNTLSADARIGTGVYCKGAIVNLLEDNLNNSFVARAYTKYTIVSNETTETHYVLANYYDNDRANNTRTMVNVANAGLKDPEANLKESDVEFLEKSYIDKYLDTVVQPVNGYPFDVDMSSGNSHTLNLTDITAENSKSAYVVGSTVKAVFVDDTRISDWTESKGEITIPHDTLAAFGKGEKIVRIWVNDGEKDLAYQGTLTLATLIIDSWEKFASFYEYAEKPTSSSWDGHFIVSEDIDGKGATFYAFCNWYYGSFNSTNGFIGTFDGRGHIISNFQTGNKPTVTTKIGGSHANIFSNIGAKGVVKNVGFAEVTKKGTASLLASNCWGTIENVFTGGYLMGAGSGNDAATMLVTNLKSGAKVRNCAMYIKYKNGSYINGDNFALLYATREDGVTIENVHAMGSSSTNLIIGANPTIEGVTKYVKNKGEDLATFRAVVTQMGMSPDKMSYVAN